MDDVVKNIDTKSLLNKILSWGFPAVFSLMGIGLIVWGTQLKTDGQWGLIGVGALISVIGCLMYGFLQIHNNDNKARIAKIAELQNEVVELKIEIKELTEKVVDLTSQVQTLKIELDRKQEKIDKLTLEKLVK